MDNEALVALAYDREIRHIRKALLKRRRRYFKCIKASLKKKLVKLGKWFCKCGKVDCLEMHHKVPLVMNGVNRIENIEVVCHECHTKIHKEAEV